MSEISENLDEISPKSDKNCVSKHCFGHKLSEIEKHFKRLKVDERDKQSINGSKSDTNNYFSPKSSPYSTKFCSSEKRQSVNGFRRQRLHLINKSRVNSENSSKVKSPEEECVAKLQDFKLCTDFSQLKSESSDETLESEDKERHKYFTKNFTFDSNEWRNNLIENSEKTLKKSEKSYEDKSDVKSNKIKKLCFKDDKTCARQAMDPTCDASADELGAYLDDTLFLPRKMSFMAEMMYT